jgi:hypothetical protein
MAKSKALIAAEARIAALELELNAAANHTAALEARISMATVVYHGLKGRIRELESVVYTRGAIATATESVTPIVTRYTKADGSVWEKTRVGNRAFSHQVN